MRVRGKIVKWEDGKGFGFIAPELAGKQIFVHINAFPRRTRRPKIGDSVTFEFGRDAQGRDRAENVAGERGAFLRGRFSKSLVSASIFLFIVALVTVSGRLPVIVLWLYLVVSVLTFAMYAYDKSAARRSAQRIPENTLHMLALLGGWPGALFAQQRLRHKSIKRSFQVVFWITLLINVSAFAYVLSPYGAWLETVLNRIAG